MNNDIELDLFNQIKSRFDKVKEINSRIDKINKDLNSNIYINQRNKLVEESNLLEKQFRENSRHNDSKITDSNIFIDANILDENEVKTEHKRIIFKLAEHGNMNTCMKL